MFSYVHTLQVSNSFLDPLLRPSCTPLAIAPSLLLLYSSVLPQAGSEQSPWPPEFLWCGRVDARAARSFLTSNSNCNSNSTPIPALLFVCFWRALSLLHSIPLPLSAPFSFLSTFLCFFPPRAWKPSFSSGPKGSPRRPFLSLPASCTLNWL